MVAMSGAIMPAPLAIPLIVDRRIAETRRRRGHLGIGVGGHDRLGRIHPTVRRRIACAAQREGGSNFDASSGSPMTPVEARNTSPGRASERIRGGFRRHPRRFAALASGKGVGIARIDDETARRTAGKAVAAMVDRRRRAFRTGKDAGNRAGSSKTTIRTSVRPLYLIPASAVAMRTPSSAGIAGTSLGASGETDDAMRNPADVWIPVADGLLAARRLLHGFGNGRVGIIDLQILLRALNQRDIAFAHEHRTDLRLDLVECGRLLLALVHDLDDMPAELGLDRLSVYSPTSSAKAAFSKAGTIWPGRSSRDRRLRGGAVGRLLLGQFLEGARRPRASCDGLRVLFVFTRIWRAWTSLTGGAAATSLS